MDDVQRELTSAVVKLTEALEEILTLTEPLLGMSDDTRGFSAQDIADARAQTGVWRAQLGRQFRPGAAPLTAGVVAVRSRAAEQTG